MILLVFAKKNFKIYLFFNFYVNLNCLKKIIFQNRMATKIKDKTRDKDLKIKDESVPSNNAVMCTVFVQEEEIKEETVCNKDEFVTSSFIEDEFTNQQEEDTETENPALKGSFDNLLVF